MKQARKGYKDLKWVVPGAACCALMAATTANAVAIAFSGALVNGCEISDIKDKTYVCEDDATTDVDTIAIGADYIVTMLGDGEMKVFTAALGVGSGVHGDLYSASTVALAVDAYVTRNVTALTTVALGAGSYVGRNLWAGTTVALGAGSYVGQNVFAGTTFALGAGGYVCKDVKTLTAALGAGTYVHRNLEATTVTLGAGAYVNRDLTAVTATLGANAYVNGHLEAVTGTLGAGACYGTATIQTPTLGAFAGAVGCPILRPRTRCTPVIYGRENY